MARACKCDRCGKLYEFYQFCDLGDAIRFKDVIINVCSLSGSPFDLCIDCRKELVEYMNKGKDTQN